jgi:nucleoside-diphosphate-sugar epimerase
MGDKAVVIGGTGHIGTYLVPWLYELGYNVVSVSRNNRQPYQPHPAWDKVEKLSMDREAMDRDNSFGPAIADLLADVVIDLICFTPESQRQLIEALRGKVGHYVSIGSIWIHGYSRLVPTLEDDLRKPFGDYGIKKSTMELELLEEARTNEFPATILHPGHIVGPGWEVVNPQGNKDPKVFSRLAKGEELTLPNFGLETLNHIHAWDIAKLIVLALEQPEVSKGEAFHVVANAAVTFRGYADAVASWFGKDANLKFLPWNEFEKTLDKEFAEATYDHVAHSPNCSNEKAKRLLGFEPRYSSLEAVKEAIDWYIANGVIEV